MRGEHTMIPMAMAIAGAGAGEQVVYPSGKRSSSTGWAPLVPPTPSVASWACQTGPRPGPWLSSPLPVAGFDAGPGVPGEARPELVEEPPRSPTGASWLCGLRRDEPGPSPRAAVPTKPQCSKAVSANYVYKCDRTR